MNHEYPSSAPAADSLKNRAAVLRRSVNAARVRLDEQNRRAELLLAELQALRARAAAVPAFAAAPVPPPAVKEAVSDSARVGAASLPAGRPRRAPHALAVAALAAFVAAQQLAASPARTPAPETATGPAPVPALPSLPPLPPVAVAAAPAPVDDGAQQALLLASAWRSPADGLTLDQRFGPALALPGSEPVWTVERTGEASYRVRRAGSGGASYALDVDLTAGRVAPTPETARLLAPADLARR